MAQEIQWAELPADAVMGGSRNTKWGSVTGTLRTNPGQWGIVTVKPNRTAAVALANTIKGGKKGEFSPTGSFESAYAEQSDGRFNVYARYVGPLNGNGAAPADSAADESDDGLDPFDDNE